MAWEYEYVKVSTMSVAALKETLNELGAGNWELVGFASADKTIGLNSLIAIMKREYTGLEQPEALEADWKIDPTGRYPSRYWDGAGWTRWVRDKPGGARVEDPLGGASAAAGETVRVRTRVKLDNGSTIPAGFIAQVRELSIIDGTPVVQIEAPDGSLRWIARENTTTT